MSRAALRCTHGKETLCVSSNSSNLNNTHCSLGFKQPDTQASHFYTACQMGLLAPWIRKGTNLKTESKMLFPGREKSVPCSLVAPSSTECAIHKCSKRLTSEQRAQARDRYCCADQLRSFAPKDLYEFHGHGPQSSRCQGPEGSWS